MSRLRDCTTFKSKSQFCTHVGCLGFCMRSGPRSLLSAKSMVLKEYVCFTLHTHSFVVRFQVRLVSNCMVYIAANVVQLHTYIYIYICICIGMIHHGYWWGGFSRVLKYATIVSIFNKRVIIVYNSGRQGHRTHWKVTMPWGFYQINMRQFIVSSFSIVLCWRFK